MSTADFVSLALVITGLFFFAVGTIGLLRLPDIFTRLHATTKCDTLGACSVLGGLIFYSGLSFASVKIFFMILFILIANPTAAHAIAKAAYLSGVRPYEGTLKDEYGGDINALAP